MTGAGPVGEWLRPAEPADAALLADIHAEAFPKPWDRAQMAAALGGFGAAGLVAGRDASGLAMLLLRAVAEEAEVLTLAVRPAARRRGLALGLVEAAAALAAGAGARSLWLEVAVDNAAGLALYRRTGFHPAGRRRGYYARRGGGVDALVMRRLLNTGGA